jgi:hypothetical protein
MQVIGTRKLLVGFVVNKQDEVCIVIVTTQVGKQGGRYPLCFSFSFRAKKKMSQG